MLVAQPETIKLALQTERNKSNMYSWRTEEGDRRRADLRDQGNKVIFKLQHLLEGTEE